MARRDYETRTEADAGIYERTRYAPHEEVPDGPGQEDVCAGSTRDNPHLWDEGGSSCGACVRRKERSR